MARSRSRSRERRPRRRSPSPQRRSRSDSVDSLGRRRKTDDRRGGNDRSRVRSRSASRGRRSPSSSPPRRDSRRRDSSPGGRRHQPVRNPSRDRSGKYGGRETRSRSRSRSRPRRDRGRGGDTPSRPFNRNRFLNSEADDFFESRKRDREAISFSIWADIPSPLPPKKEAKDKTKPEPRPASPSDSENSASSGSSASESESDSDRDDRRSKRKRKTSSRKSSKKKSSRSSSRRSKKSSRRSKSSKRSKSRRRSDSSSSEDDSLSDASSKSSASEREVASKKPRTADANLSDLDEYERSEAENFKSAVQRGRTEEEEDEDIGPKPLVETEEAANASLNYGKALLPGEGVAIAQYVQKNMRIPRRGEVGWNGQQIENLESLGYVMSGSRHTRMNAVRIRKENQVYTAEEKRALALINFEEKQQRENRIMSEFRDMLTERLTKKHGSRLVEDMESSTKAAMHQQQQQ